MDSDLTASEDALRATKILVNALDGIAKMKWVDVWDVPEKLTAVQTFPKNILRFMLTYYKKEGLLKNVL